MAAFGVGTKTANNYALFEDVIAGTGNYKQGLVVSEICYNDKNHIENTRTGSSNHIFKHLV